MDQCLRATLPDPAHRRRRRRSRCDATPVPRPARRFPGRSSSRPSGRRAHRSSGTCCRYRQAQQTVDLASAANPCRHAIRHPSLAPTFEPARRRAAHAVPERSCAASCVISCAPSPQFDDGCDAGFSSRSWIPRLALSCKLHNPGTQPPGFRSVPCMRGFGGCKSPVGYSETVRTAHVARTLLTAYPYALRSRLQTWTTRRQARSAKLMGLALSSISPRTSATGQDAVSADATALTSINACSDWGRSRA